MKIKINYLISIFSITIFFSCSNKSQNQNMLANAIKHNDLNAVKECIENGDDPDEVNEGGLNAREMLYYIQTTHKYKESKKKYESQKEEYYKAKYTKIYSNVGFFVMEGISAVLSETSEYKIAEKIKQEVSIYVKTYRNLNYKLQQQRNYIEEQKNDLELIRNLPQNSTYHKGHNYINNKDSYINSTNSSNKDSYNKYHWEHNRNSKNWEHNRNSKNKKYVKNNTTSTSVDVSFSWF
ncbi:MAG: hypothetical protein GY830_03270 [Bacteroidetes bacterium]|nr:hypothetical protein [Bacteroidota bacterium]